MNGWSEYHERRRQEPSAAPLVTPADIAREALEEIKTEATRLVFDLVQDSLPWSRASAIRLKAERAINRMDRAEADARAEAARNAPATPLMTAS